MSVPWGVPLARNKGGRGACLGGVRVREGWPRRVLSGPRAYLHTDLLHARLHLVFEPRTKGGAWWRVTTASGVSGEGLRPASPDPRCRTVRNGCKPLHAHSSCLGTTASGQHWGVPITVPVGEPTPPVPAHLRVACCEYSRPGGLGREVREGDTRLVCGTAVQDFTSLRLL